MHTIKDAMERAELTEEQAFFILRMAGHVGYKKAVKRLSGDGLFYRVRQWFIWFGGWETCWLSQVDRGAPKWRLKDENGKFTDPFPLSLFNHRITFYGGWWNFRLFKGWVVGGRKASHKLYWSPNGTPDHVGVRIFRG